MQRLVVYFHYDPRGQADSACRFAVREIQKQARAVWFVTNGRLDAESRGWARDAGLHLLERANTGFDVGAYRQVLLTLGRQALDEWDEIVGERLATHCRPVSFEDGILVVSASS